MTDGGQKRTDPGDALRDGVRAVTGILGAFKDAIEETFKELSDRGDLSPDRAKDAARETMKRAQEAVDDVRGRIEFVPRREFDALRTEVAELRAQVQKQSATAAGATQATGAAKATGSAGAAGSTGAADSAAAAGTTASGSAAAAGGATAAGGEAGDGSPDL